MENNKMLKKLLSLGLGLLSLGATAQVLTVEKLNELNKLHDVKVSPDGSRLVYGLKSPADDASKKDNNLYLLSLAAKNAKPQQLTNHTSGEYSVQWNNKGDALYFLADRTGSSQVWRISLRGGEAKQITDLPLEVADFKLSPDNNKLVLAMSVLPSCDDLKCTNTHRSAQQKVKAKGQMYEQLMVRHWSDWESQYKTHLFVGEW